MYLVMAESIDEGEGRMEPDSLWTTGVDAERRAVVLRTDPPRVARCCTLVEIYEIDANECGASLVVSS